MSITERSGARVFATILGLLLLPSCACRPSDGLRARDTADVGAMVATRAATLEAPAARCADDGSIPEAVRAVLSAPLTEDGAVRVALLNNRELRAAYEDLGIARADLIRAGLLRNPVFEGNAKFFDGATEVELSVAQSLLDAFFIPLRRRIACDELAAAKAAVARRVIGVAFAVRRSVLDQRMADEVVEIRRVSLAVASGSEELMRRLHAAGNATDWQLATETAAATTARLDLAAAEQAAAEAREPLNVLLGLWGDATTWSLAPGKLEAAALATDALDRCESRAISASLDLAEQRAANDAAARRCGLTRWESVFPELEAGLAVKQETTDDRGLGPAARVEVPVFDQGQARLAGASAELRQALARYAGLAVEVRSAARLLRTRVVALQSRVEYVRKVHLPAHQKLLQEVIRNYNAMQVGAFDVLLARRGEIGARQEELETIRDLLVAQCDLAELLAGNLNRGRLVPVSKTRQASDSGAPKGEHR